MIALSQDLVSRGDYKKFKYGEMVMLQSTNYPEDHRCNGYFEVVNTMNKRFRHRGDIFFMNRKDNISCNAHVYKLIN